MKLIKTRLVNIALPQLTAWDNNPPDRLGNKNALGTLKKAVLITNHIGSLLVFHYKDRSLEKFVVLDGHRRLAVAKELGLKEIPCEIIDSADVKIPFEEFFTHYNTSLKVGDISRQYIYKITRNEAVLNRNQRGGLYYFMKAGGIELVDRIIDEKQSLSSMHRVMMAVLPYCKKSYIQTAYGLAFATWFLDNRESSIALRVIADQKTHNPKMLWDSIENNTPVTGKGLK